LKNDCNILSAAADNKRRNGAIFSERKTARIHGLDFLRGLCVLLMILDHASFDIMMLIDWCPNFYYVDNFLTKLAYWVYYDWWDSAARLVLRLTIICVFFCISGICSAFSHNNALRSAKLAVASVTLSLFTITADKLFDLGITILFGVLHCLTVSIIICTVLQKLLKNNAKYACLGLGILFFVWGLLLDFYNLQGSQFDISGQQISALDYLRIAVGTRYYGADCFGLLPFAGIFLIGVYGGAELYKNKKPYLPLFKKAPFRPVCFVGRKAVWFYLLHQPVIFVLTVIIGTALGLKFV